jgi:hypothetical protein
MNSHPLINELSSYLFWDTEYEHINPEKNKKWIIQRVLEYGLLNDWKLIHNYYGLKEIASVVKQLKNLDNKSMSFISVLTGIPKEEFLCYSIKQSNPQYWNF